MKEKLQNYFLEKLILPKKVIINEPGIIINQIYKKHGGIRSRQRSIFYFEKIFINLQLDLKKELGEENSFNIWYKIGKDIGTRYVILSKIKKIPPIMIYKIINYMLVGFKSGGQSFCKNIEYYQKEEKLLIKGDNNVICRKTKNSGFVEGVVSAIMSKFLNKNIETKNKCECPNKCYILLDKKNEERYIPDIQELSPHNLYDKLNFPTNKTNKTNKYSFEDLIKFKKIKFKNGKIMLKNETLVAGEIGMMGIIEKHYNENKVGGIFNESLIKTSKELTKNIIIREHGVDEKMKKILNIYCMMGYGIPEWKMENGKTIISFKHPPFSKYGFLPQGKMINGVIDSILNKKNRLDEIKFDKFNSKVIFYYK